MKEDQNWSGWVLSARGGVWILVKENIAGRKEINLATPTSYKRDWVIDHVNMMIKNKKINLD